MQEMAKMFLHLSWMRNRDSSGNLRNCPSLLPYSKSQKRSAVIRSAYAEGRQKKPLEDHADLTALLKTQQVYFLTTTPSIFPSHC